MANNDWTSKAFISILLVLVGLLYYRSEHPSTTFAADGVDADWDAAASRAQDLHEPSVVLFSAGWCPACRSLHADVLPDPGVQEELRHYNFYSVDLTNPTRAAQIHSHQCGVQYIPLLIRYDAQGKETGRTNYINADELVAWLKAGE
jgi:thiol:disulfide interchange protein